MTGTVWVVFPVGVAEAVARSSSSRFSQEALRGAEIVFLTASVNILNDGQERSQQQRL